MASTPVSLNPLRPHTHGHTHTHAHTHTHTHTATHTHTHTRPHTHTHPCRQVLLLGIRVIEVKLLPIHHPLLLLAVVIQSLCTTVTYIGTQVHTYNSYATSINGYITAEQH